jgi:hypothetical protein
LARQSNSALIATLGVFAIVAIGIVGFVLWDEARTSKRLSAEAEAVGFVATPDRWYDDSKERDVSGHTLTYAYTDGNYVVHTRTMERITWYDPETTYKVCYDPEDPERQKLYPAAHVCGS